MSLKIRLSRVGAKKRPVYHIVVADSRSPRDGRFVERVGHYKPLLPKGDPGRVVMNRERISYWLGNGAKPTDRVATFLNRPVPAEDGQSPGEQETDESASEISEETEN